MPGCYGVEVIALREDVFFGNLVIELNDGQVLNIDCRPSDALALSVRAHVPILVAREVMENAGVVPEQETELERNDVESSIPDEIEEEAEERLICVRRFLQNLDIDSSSDENEDRMTTMKKKMTMTIAQPSSLKNNGQYLHRGWKRAPVIFSE
jgi:uncharacterized protein